MFRILRDLSGRLSIRLRNPEERRLLGVDEDVQTDAIALHRRVSRLGWLAVGTSGTAVCAWIVFFICLAVAIGVSGPIGWIAVALTVLAGICIGAYIFAKCFYSTRVIDNILGDPDPEDHQHAAPDHVAEPNARQALIDVFRTGSTEEERVGPGPAQAGRATRRVAPAPEDGGQQHRAAALQGERLGSALAAHENLQPSMGGVIALMQRVRTDGITPEIRSQTTSIIKQLTHTFTGKHGSPQIPEDATGCKDSIQAVIDTLRKVAGTPTNVAGIAEQLAPEQLADTVLTAVIASFTAQASQLVHICGDEHLQLLSQQLVVVSDAAEACQNSFGENASSQLIDAARNTTVAIRAILNQLQVLDGQHITAEQLAVLNQAGCNLLVVAQGGDEAGEEVAPAQVSARGQEQVRQLPQPGGAGDGSGAIYSHRAASAFLVVRRQQPQGAPEEEVSALEADIFDPNP